MDHENVIGAFSEEQVERLTGVTRAQLRRWHRTGFLAAEFTLEDSRAPYSHIYSFKDLVTLRVLNKLRNVHGVSMPELRKTADKLAHLGDDKWTATTLYVFRRKVVFNDPETLTKREVTTNQYVADIPLEVVISDTRSDVAQLNAKRDDGERGRVVKTKFVNRSAAVIAGTRIPVKVIQEFAAAGYSIAQIRKEYPTLTKEDVEAAINFNGAVAA
ncbi:MAG: DUF433 domain-containing protein [Sphingomonas sp.]